MANDLGFANRKESRYGDAFDADQKYCTIENLM